MSELSVVPASLDEILAAVKETARGRWFLENYEARLRAGETARLLQAINKLENHVTSQAKTGHDAELVKHARQAISAARRDIAALDPTISSLSTEAKLFAQLAEKARAAFTDAPPMGQSVSRALQLVGELEKELSDTQAEPAPFLTDVAAKPAQFFKQDEAIFEPAPKQAPITLAVAAESPSETGTRGAKLVVQRLGSSTPAEQPTIFEPPKQPDVSAPAVAAAPVVAETPSKSRIIVIRRKADEMENVPLLDQSDNRQHTPSDAA